ncbi:hypothetical protein [uncultured Pseudomonas sp.]|uniref:hypothetical protein n=1 Tax=uncultured Pseudomonas sp. TaxID=114707 RepID=UPI00258328D3|nr:hypothetical protein [uncultured Pseudomonas sp.]
MKWLALFSALAVSALLGLLGLIAGINLNPQSTVRFVPNMGSLGDWVSGLGAIAALSFAMWQFYFQRSKDRIFTSLIEKAAEKTWRVRLVSEGLIPVTVLGAEIRVADSVLSLPSYFGSKVGFSVPAKLERGDVQQIIDVDAAEFSKFSKWFMSPVFEAVKQQGLEARDYNYGVNEKYFEALAVVISKGATVVVRLAHDDLLQPVPAYVLEQISQPLVQIARDQATEEARQRLESDKKWIAEAFSQKN